MNKKNIAVFASGAGSNARVIIEKQATENVHYQVTLIVCNKPTAGVLDIAAEYHIPTLLISKDQFANGDRYVMALQEAKIDFIVLAGFLWKIPETLIRAFPNKIINIHPALLPKYGGKGMYGMHVHQAVVDNKEKESGITIHYVNEHYDEGETILQATCPVMPQDTAADVAAKIHLLEHVHFWKVVDTVCASI